VVSRILLYRAGALGDTLLTLPTLDALRFHYPDVELTLAANLAYAAPLLGAGRVDTLLDATAPPFHLLHQPPDSTDTLSYLLEGFGSVFFLSKNPGGTTSIRLQNLNFPKSHIAAPIAPEEFSGHTAEWYLRSVLSSIAHYSKDISQSTKKCARIGLDTPKNLKHPSNPAPVWGIDPSPTGMHFDQPSGAPIQIKPIVQLDNIQIDAIKYLSSHIDPTKLFFTIHPGGGGRSKWPPAATLIPLAQRLVQETCALPLLIQGPADTSPCNAFEEIWGVPIPRLISPRLDYLSAIFARTEAHFGGDSGVSHLAALSGARTLSLFGPTSNPRRWAPIGPFADWTYWD